MDKARKGHLKLDQAEEIDFLKKRNAEFGELLENKKT
jgi:hypothetical protein